MNDDRTEVMRELKSLAGNKGKETLILPYATIIETGNHIAHNGDGRQRRNSAERFCEVIKKTLAGEAPWAYYGNQLTEEDLDLICKDFPDAATREQGFGDLSIIRAYERYKEETPAVGEIRIWSLDKHLKDVYHEELNASFVRNR